MLHVRTYVQTKTDRERSEYFYRDRLGNTVQTTVEQGQSGSTDRGVTQEHMSIVCLKIHYTDH